MITPPSDFPGLRSWADPLHLPLHVEVHGEKGPPALFLHGFGATGYTWNRWLPHLTSSHQAVVVEMKGAGASPKPRGEKYGPREQADLIHRLILQKDLKELTLVGHSLGGGIVLMVALRLLKEDPGRLKRLVLIAPAAYRQPIPPYVRLAGRPILGTIALHLVPKGFLFHRALRATYHDPTLITASQIQAYADPIRSPDGRYALARMSREVVPENVDDIAAEYPTLELPTLLLWGRQDRIVPLPYGQRLVKDLPQAQLKVMEECGHIPHEEKPEESFEIFRSFLER